MGAPARRLHFLQISPKGVIFSKIAASTPSQPPKTPQIQKFRQVACRFYFACFKKRFTFNSVFIGYGLKTGQGVYPGPIVFGRITSNRYPRAANSFNTIGNASRNLSNAFSLS